MAVTAHRDAGGPGGPPEGRPGPGIREALVTEARACRLAVEDLARRPGDPAALEMARLTLSVLEHLGEKAFGREVDEALIEALCARAVEQDRAARPRGRGNLRVL